MYIYNKIVDFGQGYYNKGEWLLTKLKMRTDTYSVGPQNSQINTVCPIRPYALQACRSTHIYQKYYPQQKEYNGT